MKKTVILNLIILIISGITFGQAVPGNDECIYCGSNELGLHSSAIGTNNQNFGEMSLSVGTENFINQKLDNAIFMGTGNKANKKLKGSYSIALGTNNSVNYDYSYILGKDNVVEAPYSAAIGLGNNVSGIASVALGSWCKTYRTYGIAIGMGCEADSMSTAIGFHALSLNTKSFAFGNYVKSLGQKSMSLGSGLSSSTYLENNVDNSLMIGFNSDVPTFFVSSSSGTNTTGSIGIGNITAPQAKLHIKADVDEDASIFLQQSNKYALLYLGDLDHYIQGKTGYDMIFHSQTGHNFAFQNGNVGIGTDSPGAKLQVNGNIFIEDDNSGLILKSPDGQCWKGTIDNNGNFSFESVDCGLLTGNNKPSLSQQKVDIFPNPAGSKLLIILPDNVNNAKVVLYNEQGVLLQKRVLSGGKNSLSLKKTAKGVLIVKVFSNSGELLSSEKVMHL